MRDIRGSIMPTTLSHRRGLHPSRLPAENRDESWLWSNWSLSCCFCIGWHSAAGWIMEVLRTNMKLSGANMKFPGDKYERHCEREFSSQPAAGWWAAAVALLQQGRRNRESRRRKAAATAAEICLNRGRGLGWGLSGWCLFWRFLMFEGAMFYMPTNFAFQVRKRLKHWLLATSRVKGTWRPDGTVASESTEVALWNRPLCLVFLV